MAEDNKEETVEKCNDTKMKKAEEVVKAEPEVKETPEKDANTETPDFITKAALDGEIKKALDQIETIQKAHDEMKKAHDELKAEVEKMKEFTIQKAGNVVVIQEQAKADNPMMGNFKAVEG